MLKRNPRKVTGTVHYRCKHRKGVEEETAKKRTNKVQRVVVGASFNEILAKETQGKAAAKMSSIDIVLLDKYLEEHGYFETQVC